MTTKHSPLSKIQAQADKMAAALKSMERDASVAKGETINFAIVMDDKVIRIEAAWSMIRATEEAALAAYIVKQMREEKESA